MEFPPLLDLRFRNKKLLEQALTHRSQKGPNNERLEFLGDRVLDLVIAEELYIRFPNEREGRMTHRQATLVRTETLAEISVKLGLSEHFSLKGMLADAMEAVIGAMYLDRGLEATRQFILEHWKEYIAAGPKPDPKTQLQEITQGRGLGRPEYRTVLVKGPDHRPTYRVRCAVKTAGAVGEGFSKREAEIEAAKNMLKLLT